MVSWISTHLINDILNRKKNRQTIEVFNHRRLKINVDALDVVLHLTLEQLRNGAFGRSSLHLDFQLVLKDTAELLDVVLHERIEGFPSKRFCELSGSYGLVGRLKVIKYALKSQSQTFGWNVVFGGYLVDSLIKDIR